MTVVLLNEELLFAFRTGAFSAFNALRVMNATGRTTVGLVEVVVGLTFRTAVLDALTAVLTEFRTLMANTIFKVVTILARCAFL